MIEVVLLNRWSHLKETFFDFSGDFKLSVLNLQGFVSLSALRAGQR
jgi:hypothetical protein